MKAIPYAGALALSVVLFCQGASASTTPIAVGNPAPIFTYHLLDGKTLTPNQLQGRKYILWVMATWCPSCTTGSQVVAQHIAELQRHHVALVEMEAYDDLGASGPSLQSIKDGIGNAAASSNWHWGILNEEQTLAIDPKSSMDVFYLIDAHGRVVSQGMAPGAHWDQVESFMSAP
jgi:thiol-disulfide isomerase/thioredoxin